MKKINIEFFIGIIIAGLATCFGLYQYEVISSTYKNGTIVDTKVISRYERNRSGYSLKISYNDQEYSAQVFKTTYDSVKSDDIIKLKYLAKYSSFQDIDYKSYKEPLFFGVFFFIIFIYVLITIPAKVDVNETEVVKKFKKLKTKNYLKK